jgi:UDP-N-acetylmuramyl pentapeptide phosphotransferase/UDP-N-acetylglucosamine-1-phosphate transferase
LLLYCISSIFTPYPFIPLFYQHFIGFLQAYFRMDTLFLASLLSFALTFVAMPVVIRIADAKHLFDLPGLRKVHFVPVPSLGGVGIFIAVAISILTLVDFSSAPELQYFLAAMLIIFFLGLKDDLYLISPLQKFMGQCLAAFILSFQGDYQLNSFYGFLGLHELLQPFSMAFTYMTILVVINAFNLIDGVDGLAGTLSLMSTLFFGVVFSIEGDMPHAILAFTTAAAILGFLAYNYSPARIFLGDTGSLMIGLVNAALVIRFINKQSMEGTVFNFDAAPAIAFAALFIPLADTLRVTVMRIYHGRLPFDPDVTHIHHILLNRGLSHTQITGVLGLASLAFLAFAILFQSLGINFVILSLFVIAYTIVGIVHRSSSSSPITKEVPEKKPKASSVEEVS